MITGLLLLGAAGVAVALGIRSRRVERAYRVDIARERSISAMLERMLDARVEAEDAAVAQAYCEGWSERAAFEECVRQERREVVVQRLKGLSN